MTPYERWTTLASDPATASTDRFRLAQAAAEGHAATDLTAGDRLQPDPVARRADAGRHGGGGTVTATECTCNGQWTCCYCTGCAGCSDCEPED